MHWLCIYNAITTDKRLKKKSHFIINDFFPDPQSVTKNFANFYGFENSNYLGNA